MLQVHVIKYMPCMSYNYYDLHLFSGYNVGIVLSQEPSHLGRPGIHCHLL